MMHFNAEMHLIRHSGRFVYVRFLQMNPGNKCISALSAFLPTRGHTHARGTKVPERVHEVHQVHSIYSAPIPPASE